MYLGFCSGNANMSIEFTRYVILITAKGFCGSSLCGKGVNRMLPTIFLLNTGGRTSTIYVLYYVNFALVTLLASACKGAKSW